MTPGERPEPEPEPEIITTEAVNAALATLALSDAGLETTPEEKAAAEVVLLKSRGAKPSARGSAGWRAGEYVLAGAVRTAGGLTYECTQPHLTQQDWTPGVTPALWRVAEAGGETQWQADVAYSAGDIRGYNGIDYSCVQAHTSQPGWEPPSAPALWAEAGH